MRKITAALVAVALLTTAPARADVEAKQVCIAAAERGQELQRAGKLRDARAQLALCARDDCPNDVSGDCKQWLAQAEALLATVVLRAREAERITVDGESIPPGAEGAPIQLEPGRHVFRFERGGSEPIEETVVLAMGERDRVIQVHFRAKPPPSQPIVHERPVPLGVFVLAGIGVVGAATATGLWVSGTNDLSDLRRDCGPTCPDADRSSATRTLLIGDVVMGVAVVALAAAAYFYVTRGQH